MPEPAESGLREATKQYQPSPPDKSDKDRRDEHKTQRRRRSSEAELVATDRSEYIWAPNLIFPTRNKSKACAGVGHSESVRGDKAAT